MKIKKSELERIIQEEIGLVNGNGSAYGLPGNWAAKVMPEFEIELEEQEDEIYSKLGAFLAKLSDEGHGELAEELDSILFNLQESKVKKVQEGLDETQWGGFVREGKGINYSDVQREYEAILTFLKQDILQKTGAKYVADALEMLANDIRDQVHSPDPYDKDNWAYFDRDSGTQPNLSEAELNENALIDLAMLDYLWKNLGVPGSLDKFINSTRGIDKKIDDWFKNNMKNPLVRGLYKALMLTGPSPGDNYRHDKKWERGELEESVLHALSEEFYSALSEEAKSKAQQRFMGMVNKCQKDGDCASPEVEKAASSMKKKDVKDFAKTKHDGLPNKVPKEEK